MEQIVLSQLLCAAVLLLGLSCVKVSGVDSLPNITDKTFIDDCVRIHNVARSAVKPAASDMLYMTWDAGLAVTARAWGRMCTFQHNIHLGEAKRVHPVFPSVGENIWVASGSQFSVEKAIQRWVKEVNFYSYQTNSCQNNEQCGHYTQVVWASTYKVGCAFQLCPNGIKHFIPERATIFVCNYSPHGNVVDLKPYKTGAACRACEGKNNECQDNFCRNPQREALRSYNWTPDWDPALSTSGSSCLAIRPLGLLVTVIVFIFP